MPEALTCTQCGGILNEDYVCSYCGARFKKPDAPEVNNVTINVTNNFHSQPATPTVVVPTSSPVNAETREPESTGTLVEAPQDNNSEEPTTNKGNLEEFVDNSSGLLILMLLASAGLIIFGVNTDNDFMLIVGGVIGAIFLFLSSHYHKRKGDDK